MLNNIKGAINKIVSLGLPHAATQKSGKDRDSVKEAAPQDITLNSLNINLDYLIHINIQVKRKLATFSEEWKEELETLKGGKNWATIKREVQSLTGQHAIEKRDRWDKFRLAFLDLAQSCVHAHFTANKGETEGPVFYWLGTPGFESDLDVTISGSRLKTGFDHHRWTETHLLQAKFIAEQLFYRLTGKQTGSGIDTEFYFRHFGLIIDDSTAVNPSQFHRLEVAASLIQAFRTLTHDHFNPDHPGWIAFKQLMGGVDPEWKSFIDHDCETIEKFFTQFRQDMKHFVVTEYLKSREFSTDYLEDGECNQIYAELTADPKMAAFLEEKQYLHRMRCNIILSEQLDALSQKLKSSTRRITHFGTNHKTISDEETQLAKMQFEYYLRSLVLYNISFDHGCNSVGFLKAIVENREGQTAARRYEEFLQIATHDLSRQPSLKDLLSSLESTNLPQHFSASLESFAFGCSSLFNNGDADDLVRNSKQLVRAYEQAVCALKLLKTQIEPNSTLHPLVSKQLAQLEQMHQLLQSLLRIKRNRYIHPNYLTDQLQQEHSLDQQNIKRLLAALTLPNITEDSEIDAQMLKKDFCTILEDQLEKAGWLASDAQKRALNHLKKKIEPLFNGTTIKDLRDNWNSAFNVLETEFQLAPLETFQSLFEKILTHKPDGPLEVSNEMFRSHIKLNLPWNAEVDLIWNPKMMELTELALGNSDFNPETKLTKENSYNLFLESHDLFDSQKLKELKKQIANVYADFVGTMHACKILKIDTKYNLSLDPITHSLA